MEEALAAAFGSESSLHSAVWLTASSLFPEPLNHYELWISRRCLGRYQRNNWKLLFTISNSNKVHFYFETVYKTVIFWIHSTCDEWWCWYLIVFLFNVVNIAFFFFQHAILVLCFVFLLAVLQKCQCLPLWSKSNYFNNSCMEWHKILRKRRFMVYRCVVVLWFFL